MKEQRNCKIVQDLLPNYIEKLTNNVTNQYIEEHLKECSECQKICKNMKKDYQVNSTKQDNREIKYIKKYSNKLKILRNILLLIILLFVIIVGRKTIILTNLSNKAQDFKNSQNYYLRLEVFGEGTIKIIDTYKKQDKVLMRWTTYSKDKGKIKQTFYKSEDEEICLIDNGETKILNEMVNIGVHPISFTSDIFLGNLYMAITKNIDKINLNGKECYIIRDGNTEKFVDVNTGLAIKMIDNQNNQTADYTYEDGIVTDADVERPDTTGYIVNN